MNGQTSYCCETQQRRPLVLQQELASADLSLGGLNRQAVDDQRFFEVQHRHQIIVQPNGQEGAFAPVEAHGSVHFEGSHARVAIDWGANLSAWVTSWLALSAEASGVSWVHEAPEWMGQRVVTLGGGLRFHLPYGWRPGLWVRAPVTDTLTDFGYGTFVGVEIIWQHDRDWFLF